MSELEPLTSLTLDQILIEATICLDPFREEMGEPVHAGDLATTIELVEGWLRNPPRATPEDFERFAVYLEQLAELRGCLSQYPPYE